MHRTALLCRRENGISESFFLKKKKGGDYRHHHPRPAVGAGDCRPAASEGAKCGENRRLVQIHLQKIIASLWKREETSFCPLQRWRRRARQPARAGRWPRSDGVIAARRRWSSTIEAASFGGARRSAERGGR